MRTVQTLHDRQQKMATAGARPPRRVRREARAGRRRRSRSSRSAAAASSSASSSAPRSRSSARSDGEVLEAAIQQFYELRGAPPEIHVPAEPDEREALETWLSERAGAARADRRAAARREARLRRSRQPQRRARAIRRASTRRQAAQYDALETLQPCSALPALPRADRVLRHLDDSGQRDRRVDGRLRGRPHAARRVSKVPDPGLGPAG